MTNELELQEIINKLKIKTRFTGIRCKDELRGNNASDSECGIINLNDSTVSSEENKKTGHWVAYFKKNSDSYYFCSYGSPVPIDVVNYVRVPVHTHNFQIQSFSSNICGELSCLWLLLMDRGMDYYDAVLTLVKLSRQ